MRRWWGNRGRNDKSFVWEVCQCKAGKKQDGTQSRQQEVANDGQRLRMQEGGDNAGPKKVRGGATACYWGLVPGTGM